MTPLSVPELEIAPFEPAGALAGRGTPPAVGGRRTGPPLRVPRRLPAARWLCRATDVTAALLVLALSAPLWLAAAAMHVFRGPVFARKTCWGWRRRPFATWSVLPSADGRMGCFRQAVRRLVPWWQVLAGKLTLVGPRLIGPDESDRSLCAVEARFRFRVRPGLVGLAELRRRAKIDYASELAIDREYLAGRSLRGDAGILLRSLAAALWNDRAAPEPEVVEIFGLRLWNVSMAQAIDEVLRLAQGTAPRQVSFVNADCVNLAAADPVYRRALQESHRLLADGIGVKLAVSACGYRLRQNLCGTDLFPQLCAALEHSPLGLFLLGARPGVAEAVAAWVAQHYPGTQVKGWHHGYFTPDEEDDVLRAIRQSGAEILLVAFGAPRQDVWIHQHLDQTGARVALGVGGLLDFYSGRIPRAPLWVRELSLEWAYRLLQEPGRLWRRYLLGNARFLGRVAVERLRRPPPAAERSAAAPRN